MVNSVVAGSILTILAWSLLRLAPRLNARTRVAVWLSVLVAIPGLAVAATLIGRPSSTLASPSARIIVPEGWAFEIFIAWALLATLALLRVVIGLWRIRALRRTCKPIDLADLDSQVRAIIGEYRPKRPVALLQSKTARVPMAVGFFRPAVILPQWVMAELSANEISAILIHEFAHLRCWDDWTNFFQKLVRAGFFFHPSVWWVDRRLALEREIACDDAVLAATNQAHDYARCLVDLAEKSLVRRSLAMAQAAVHRVQHISVRIGKILDSSRPHATRVSKIALADVAGLAGLCLIALLQSPALIAFQGSVVATAAPVAHRPGAPDVATVASAVRDAAKATKVVPVVMRERSNIPRHSSTRAKQSNVALAHAKSRDVVLPASFAPQPPPPKVLRAGLTIHQQTVIPVESVLFVMPDARLDAAGRVVWTFSVWRLTVFHPAQMPAEGTIPDSI
jgi:beta-lactamase regulating signal transducer with metallopeptidase domain